MERIGILKFFYSENNLLSIIPVDTKGRLNVVYKTCNNISISDFSKIVLRLRVILKNENNETLSTVYLILYADTRREIQGATLIHMAIWT